MKVRGEWETFFDGHAPIYMQNLFTRDTENEVAFLVKELALPLASRILDIGCGTGRHAIALARRGHRVTGLDLSSGMLAQAVKAANEAGTEVRWIHADATRFTTRTRFDAAICLCEGAFSLLGMKEDAEEHDRSSAMPGGRSSPAPLSCSRLSTVCGRSANSPRPMSTAGCLTR